MKYKNTNSLDILASQTKSMPILFIILLYTKNHSKIFRKDEKDQAIGPDFNASSFICLSADISFRNTI